MNLQLQLIWLPQFLWADIDVGSRNIVDFWLALIVIVVLSSKKCTPILSEFESTEDSFQ
jgi:hypothetical protein